VRLGPEDSINYWNKLYRTEPVEQRLTMYLHFSLNQRQHKVM